ncbi:uncharacterized protein [Ranitomeya imitator]|uniref:uncharacterized protein n=1 Tax=Ranitomeya imitator TaxID=111125 RepID=UPI0037E8EED8
MEFRKWVLDTTWCDSAKYAVFRRGLSASIKDELARGESPTNLADFIHHCIRIDIRLTERRQEKWADANHNNFLPFPSPTKEALTKTLSQTELEPMQVDAVRRKPIDARLPWLRLRNPTINWTTKELQFPNESALSGELAPVKTAVTVDLTLLVEYRDFSDVPGSRNKKADALSRIHSDEATSASSSRTILSEKNFVSVLHNQDLLTEIKEAYAADSLLSQPPTRVNLTFKNGLWFQGQRLYIPETVKLSVLKLMHDSKFAGHRGVQKTQEFLSRFFWWLTFRKDVLRYVSSCESNSQTERTNQTLEQYLRCYVCHLQDDWVSLLPLAEFTYNNSQNASTKLSPFFANKGYHPSILPRLPIDMSVPAVADRIVSLQQNLDVLKNTLVSAQERFKKAADRFRKPAPTYKVGDMVWLSTKNLKLRIPTSKLGQKYVGPYKISGIVSPVACRLKLPNSLKIHPVFHVSLLKPAVPNSFPGRTSAPPDPVLIDGQEEFVVEKILDSRIHRGRLQYLVKWQGYSVEENSWEPLENIHAPHLIRLFHSRYPNKPDLRSSRGRLLRRE